MKETVYLCQQTEKESYRHHGKKGYKAGDMSFITNSSPVYGVTTKTEAIAECRRMNRRNYTGMVYYPQKIEIFK